MAAAAAENDEYHRTMVSNTPQSLLLHGNIARLTQKIREEGYVITQDDRIWALLRAAEHGDIDLLLQLNNLGFGLTIEFINEQLVTRIGPHLYRDPPYSQEIIPNAIKNTIHKDKIALNELLFMLFLYSRAYDPIPAIPEHVQWVLMAAHMKDIIANMIEKLYKRVDVGNRIVNVIYAIGRSIGMHAIGPLIVKLLDAVLEDIIAVKAEYADELEEAAKKGKRLEPDPFAEFYPILRFLMHNYNPSSVSSVMISRAKKRALTRRSHILAHRIRAQEQAIKPAAPTVADKVRAIFQAIGTACRRPAACGGAAAGAGGGSSRGGRRTRRRRSSRRL